MITNLRLDAEGIAASFEEFCCQLFHRAPEEPAKSGWRRIRGAGGDGGVEATWTLPNQNVWGLQAKFFNKLDASEKAQLTESVKQAAANYPTLERYTICLPFNLTGKKGAKGGKPKSGQHEKLSAWIDEWKNELAKEDRSVEFELWDESTLRERLAAADPSGGLTRYWFEKEAFPDTWFNQRLIDAKAQAGRRYSPELAVATPLDDALQAFGRSELWINKIERLRDRFSDKLRWWRRTTEHSAELPYVLQTELRDNAKALLVSAEHIENDLGLATESPEVLTSRSFRNAVRSAIDGGLALEQLLRAELLKQYGPSADTAGFRQYHAEYQVDFPMAPLDHLREFLAVLKQVECLAFQPEGQLPASTAMLLRGEAGIGKTHGIVDTALRRSEQGLRSVILFGEDFTAADPWNSIVAKLGFGSAVGRDSMLDALNAAGEASGFPLVIFIDALNETQPARRKWQHWLPPILEQIKTYPFLKLCVSCRDTYLGEVIPTQLELPAIIHNGFLGREYEAQFAFFQHFGLGVPAEPLLQDEFSNPLFLRLVCEALQASGAQAVPTGREGIRSIINLLLFAKNKRAAIVCDYDPRENRLGAAMLCLASAMAEAAYRHLPLVKAKELVDRSPTPLSKSLLSILEGESLITIFEQPAAFFGGDAAYSVRFTFERVGDHLIAEALLSKVDDIEKAFANGGTLNFLTNDADASANAGLLEALSIQLPETHSVELIDLLKGGHRLLLWRFFIAGLQWRNPDHISDRTSLLLMEALHNGDIRAKALEAILGLAARPSHPLNATFLDQLLRRCSMVARDPFWSNMLETSYSGWSDQVVPDSRVHKLIDTACRGQLDALPDEVARLWTTVLAWFCASPDRRIRDRATLGMVNILRTRPNTITWLIRKFANTDDEYIAERVLLAAYGALLLCQSKPHVYETAAELYQGYFAEIEPPLNASLRDHARLIIELAVELGVPPPRLEPKRYRPPYSSPWPITLPSEEDVKPLGEDRNRFPQMQLVQGNHLATATDFARYIVEPKVINAFDIQSAGLDKFGLFRWFLKRAEELGYPGPGDRCAIFDKKMLARFGPGRGKPGWAERLGKKYYWIFLRQLVGQLADHLAQNSWSGPATVPSSDPQGFDLRDLDPTDLRMFARNMPENNHWLLSSCYVFARPDSPKDDTVWVVEDDLPDIGAALILTDDDANQWQALDLPSNWRGRRTDRKVSSHRSVRRRIRAFTCRAADIGRLKRAFADGSLDFFDRDPRNILGYLGEYPKHWPYTRYLADPGFFGGKNAGIEIGYLGIRQLRGGEWERDYGFTGGSPSLLMPSTELIEASDLHWDGRGGWLDAQGVTQVMDPLWHIDEVPGLIIRADYLNRILEEKGKVLVVVGVQQKVIVDPNVGPGRLSEYTLFVRSKNKTKLIGRKVEPETYARC